MSTPNLAITHMTASQSQKEVTANAAFDKLDVALTDYLAVAMADANQTLSSDNALQHMVFEATGALSVGRNIVTPTNKKLYIVLNSTTGGFDVTVKTSAGTGIAVSPGEGYKVLYCDGTNIVQVSAGSAVAFLDLSDTPSSYSGAGGYAVQVNSGATALEFVAKIFDVGLFVGGTFGASQILLRIPVAHAISFPVNLTTSWAVLGTAATAETIFSIQKNGVEFATIHFAAGASVGAFSTVAPSPPTAVTFVAGDILSVVAPSSADATAADLGATIAGTRT